MDVQYIIEYDKRNTHHSHYMFSLHEFSSYLCK